MIGALPVRPTWFKALVRLWCLRAVPEAPRGNPVVASMALGASWLAAWVGIDWWQRQPAPAFVLDGVPLLGWYAVGVLSLAGVIRWRARPGPGPAFGAALVLALGLTPAPLLLMSVAYTMLDAFWFYGAAAAVALYGVLYLARGLHALTGRSQRLAAMAGVLFTAGFIWTSDALNAIPDVWNPLDTQSAITDDVLAERETALFEQSDRIDAALESVQRDESAHAETFFLGFAGVGDQPVFEQEINLASRVVGERFGVGGRHLSLINDERNLEAAPLASVSGLRYALKGLAARMLEQDVLFLAISSHGSDDPAIAVSNSGLPLQNLDEQDLADALHESGIRWRVIVISACYAGGFIDSLRDPQSIIITAAAADRTSFGCSSDSDLTYFGAAFYRDALPGARSLREAFETAKKAIAAREQAEHETPSNPQAWFGAELEEKLEALRR